jgi:hypothetical protein
MVRGRRSTAESKDSPITDRVSKDWPIEEPLLSSGWPMGVSLEANPNAEPGLEPGAAMPGQWTSSRVLN